MGQRIQTSIGLWIIGFYLMSTKLKKQLGQTCFNILSKKKKKTIDRQNFTLMPNGRIKKQWSGYNRKSRIQGDYSQIFWKKESYVRTPIYRRTTNQLCLCCSTHQVARYYPTWTTTVHFLKILFYFLKISQKYSIN